MRGRRRARFITQLIKHAARKLKRAQILLAADAGAGDEDIAISVGVGGSTVYRTKRRFLVGNLEEALSEEPRPGASRPSRLACKNRPTRASRRNSILSTPSGRRARPTS